MIARFFHRLFHYHCTECIEEELQLRSCTSCETLRQQLALANQENSRLLDLIIVKNQPVIEKVDNQPSISLGPKTVPWRVRQQMLEQADREMAATMARNKVEAGPVSSISDLEKELGVEDATQ